MRVTIVTSTLNVEATIERAIRSVCEQTCPDWEHLVVDGGSSDATLAIVRRHPHVRFVSEPDRGVFDALNKGVLLARGEWILFLGADDVLHSPRVLGRMGRELVEPYDVVYGDVISPRFGGRYDGPFDAAKLLRRNICHQAIFFRRRLFERLGGFDLRYPVNADWEHNLRWFFDPATRARWVDVIVADFAAGGLSTRGEPSWKRDRRSTYLRYAHASLPARRRYALLLRELGSATRRGDRDRLLAGLALGARIVRGSFSRMRSDAGPQPSAPGAGPRRSGPRRAA